jgi:hypothetical protein
MLHWEFLVLLDISLYLSLFYVTPYLNVGHEITNNLFGSAQYASDIEKPTKGLYTYGFKIGSCF